ncbi:hypothetical protein HanIR_Chr06g0274161 [Helianthus annuus]|nr:hypothetical protein HanIR_Chr06g0274161 [Helianthus annuus]
MSIYVHLLIETKYINKNISTYSYINTYSERNNFFNRRNTGCSSRNFDMNIWAINHFMQPFCSINGPLGIITKPG